MMFKRLFLLAAIAFSQFQVLSQEMPSSVDEVISWKFSIEYDGCDAFLVFTVDQKDGWHIYAQEQAEDAIAVPTTFTFVSSPNYKLKGKALEFGAESHKDEELGITEKYFPGKQAKFKQRIEIISKKDFEIKVGYEFMACKKACFPPTYYETTFKVKGRTEDCDAHGSDVQENNGNDGGDNNETGSSAITTLDSTLSKFVGSCEGFSYYDKFNPVKVRSNPPVFKGEGVYELSVSISVDSIFSMYDFEKGAKYTSLFRIVNDSNVVFDGKPRISLQSEKNMISKPDTMDFLVIYTQDIKLKNPEKLDTLFGFMDVYLQGCSANFVNAEPINISFDMGHPIYLDQDEDKNSLWLIFILAFASGLIALLTPCVFPMIPMTVTFFTKQAKTRAQGFRKALLYAIFIVVIYVLLGVLFSAVFGAGALNAMATNPWVNLCFAILFVIFAISFLGAFEITLPSSWVNKADKQADKGGLIGIFFMAFTLALVSFSCTGPIVGSVLVQSAEGGQVVAPIIAMLGFSTALALPFGLFAAFPGWLNSLPQSGGWLNTVKVVLGFLEIAFAMKFLLQADQGFETYMFMREQFIAIWVAVFLVLGIYLLGFITFPHDSKVERLSVGRGMLGLISISFVFYLLPGIWGAPVNIISGLAPSKKFAESPYGVNVEAPKKGDDMPESAEYHGHGIWVIKDYDDALTYAKEQKKPLLIDFTGIQCVNCRKMEDFVWADEEISPIMAEEFVIASLFVDDKAKLPKEKWVTLEDGTVLDEVGKKWFNFQTSKYAQGTQPLYIVVDHEEKNISGKASYDSHSDPDDFKDWLEGALVQFELSQNPNVSMPQYKLIP